MFRQQQAFKQAVKKPGVLGPEHNVWFWNPNRFGIKFAPEDFRDKLKDQMGKELEITWNPMIERWLVWSKAHQIQHKICQGWRLLFIHNGADGGFLPLDERVFARLYAASVHEHGSAKQYFQRICDEMERDREKRDKQRQQDAIDIAMPYWEHSQIKNIGKGNKFSTYFA